MNIKVQILTDYVFRQKNMQFVNSIYFFFVYRYARIINYIKQYIFRSLYRCGGTMFLTRRCFLFVFYWGFLCPHNSSFTA